MITTCGDGHSNTVVVISTNIINGVFEFCGWTTHLEFV